MKRDRPDKRHTLPILVIGYGNTLRRDDGAGVVVAEAVMAWGLPDVRAIARHQLTPELAADIADAEKVVFVDAVSPQQAQIEVALHPLALPDRGTALTDAHASNPESLLALASQLYQATPQAYLLTIPAKTFEFGETLSAQTQHHVDQALNTLRVFITKANH